MNSIVSKRSPSQIFYKREVAGTLHFLTKDLFILYNNIAYSNIIHRDYGIENNMDIGIQF